MERGSYRGVVIERGAFQVCVSISNDIFATDIFAKDGFWTSAIWMGRE